MGKQLTYGCRLAQKCRAPKLSTVDATNEEFDWSSEEKISVLHVRHAP